VNTIQIVRAASQPTQPAQAYQLIRPAAARAQLQISRTTLNKLVKEGKLPKPIDIGGGRAVAFLQTDLDDYIASIVATSRPSKQGAAQ